MGAVVISGLFLPLPRPPRILDVSAIVEDCWEMIDFLAPADLWLRDCDLDLDRVLERDLDFLRDFLSTFWKGGSSGMANSNPTLGFSVADATGVETVEVEVSFCTVDVVGVTGAGSIGRTMGVVGIDEVAIDRVQVAPGRNRFRLERSVHEAKE